MATNSLPHSRAKEAPAIWNDEVEYKVTQLINDLLDEALANTQDLDLAVRTYLIRNRERLQKELSLDETFNKAMARAIEELTTASTNLLNEAKSDYESSVERLEHIVDVRLQAIEKQSDKTYTIKVPKLPVIKEKNLHFMVPELLQHVQMQDDVMLVGPAGSGKGVAARQVAEAMKLKFYSIPCSDDMTKFDLVGYMNSQGKYVRSILREGYEHGGIILIDEVDAANSNVLVSTNSLADGVYGFPDGMVERHPDCYIICAANTYGFGADRIYAGRNQLDGATLNRYSFLEFGYDEDLEMKISPVAEWTLYVQEVRKVMNEKKIRQVLSPRNSISGGKLLLAGVPLEQVEARRMFAGWSAQDVEICMRKAGGYRDTILAKFS